MTRAERIEKSLRNLIEEAERLVWAEEDEGRKLPHLSIRIRQANDALSQPREPTPSPAVPLDTAHAGMSSAIDAAVEKFRQREDAHAATRDATCSCACARHPAGGCGCPCVRHRYRGDEP